MTDHSQMDLFAWAESRPKAKVIGITQYILRNFNPETIELPKPADLIVFKDRVSTMNNSTPIRKSMA